MGLQTDVVSNSSVPGSDLSRELATLQKAYDVIAERQARIMELIGCSEPSKLVHDIRNVLNERELLRALADLGT